MRVEDVTAGELLANEDAMAFLTVWEASNNVIIGWARRNDPKMKTRFLVLYEDSSSGAKVCGAAMLTEEFFPLLMAVPTTTEAAVALEEYLSETPLLGANGPEAAAATFAAKRAARGRDPAAWVPEVALVCYEATPESFCFATPKETEAARWLDGDADADLDLLKALIDDFSVAVDQRPSGDMAARRLKDKAGKFLVLETTSDEDKDKGTVCALAASARTTPRYGIITSVFTPDTWRRQGCARRAVSAVAKHLLQEKERVALFADQDKAGPNQLYLSLGFSPVSTMQAWKPPKNEKDPLC